MRPPPKYPAERWERIVLVPGVELHINTAGGPMLRRMAEEIFAAYGPAMKRTDGLDGSGRGKTVNPEHCSTICVTRGAVCKVCKGCKW